jgi:hypothetical protein
LFFVMIFIAGAGPPPEVLSDPLRRIADLLPLTHAIRLLQDAWLSDRDSLPVGSPWCF